MSQKKQPNYDSVSSWEGVCAKLNISVDLPMVQGVDEDSVKYIVAAYQAEKITKAYNLIDEESGVTGPLDKTMYFYKGDENGAGFSFRNSNYVNWGSDSDTDAAARLCNFRTWSAADHAGPSHLSVWKMLSIGK